MFDALKSGDSEVTITSKLAVTTMFESLCEECWLRSEKSRCGLDVTKSIFCLSLGDDFERN